MLCNGTANNEFMKNILYEELKDWRDLPFDKKETNRGQNNIICQIFAREHWIVNIVVKKIQILSFPRL